MNIEEKDRLFEVLFFEYFNQKEDTELSAEFWSAITQFCIAYGINHIAISKAMRQLFSDANKPTELEEYYLLSRVLGLSVRQIKRITGIYWQKQKAFDEQINTEGPPKIQRRVTDVIARKSVKDFIYAMKSFFGILSDIDCENLSNLT